MDHWLVVLGRVALGGAFVVAGVRNGLAFGMLAPMLGQLGVPLPRLALVIGIVVQTACGLALALGLHAAWAALGLIGFVLAATMIVHGFWAYQGAERVAHVNGVISNVAVIGGLLLALVGAL